VELVKLLAGCPDMGTAMNSHKMLFLSRGKKRLWQIILLLQSAGKR